MPERSFWRGLSALIPQDTRERMTSAGALSLAPGNFHWLQTLRNHGQLSIDFHFFPHAYGVNYPDRQRSTVGDIVDDLLAMNLILLTKEGSSLVTAAEDMISATEDAVLALAQLAGNLAIAAGGEPDGARARARERAYFEIDPEFRRWVGELSSSTVVDEAKAYWVEKAERIVHQLGDVLVGEAGANAWVGRERSIGGHVSSPEAFEWFLRSLRKALPKQRFVTEIHRLSRPTDGGEHDS
jgi:CRISPR system Cascade subunit CasA